MDDNSILSIFIVEDDLTLGDSLAAIFDLKGYSVALFENAAAALSAFTEGIVPRLIVMDGDLPGMSGPEAIRAIREAGFTGVFVGISAADYEEDMLAAGAVSFWEKPFDVKEFLDSIEKLTNMVRI